MTKGEIISGLEFIKALNKLDISVTDWDAKHIGIQYRSSGRITRIWSSIDEVAEKILEIEKYSDIREAIYLLNVCGTLKKADREKALERVKQIKEKHNLKNFKKYNDILKEILSGGK